MPETVYHMQHDLEPELAGVLLDYDGAPIDLTGADALWLIWRPVNGGDGDETRVECEIVDANPDLEADPDAIQWRYALELGDTDAVEARDYEHEIEWPTARPQTVPNRVENRNTWVLGDDLDTTQPS